MLETKEGLGVAVRELTLAQAIREALAEEMRRDPRVFILGEDIAEAGHPFKVLTGLVDEFGTKRVLDTPISEAGFTGVAVGAAMTDRVGPPALAAIERELLAHDLERAGLAGLDLVGHRHGLPEAPHIAPRQRPGPGARHRVDVDLAGCEIVHRPTPVARMPAQIEPCRPKHPPSLRAKRSNRPQAVAQRRREIASSA